MASSAADAGAAKTTVEPCGSDEWGGDLPLPSPTPSPSLSASSSFAELVLSLVRIPNPQYLVDGRAGEQAIMDAVCQWLSARGILHEADPTWGVHAVLQGPGGLAAARVFF